MIKDIQILPPHLIEEVKWNNCIQNSSNGLIYAQYDYLDNICDNWHGLIVGNYEAIMALPWRKKYGLTYYYTPPFIQQLGLIGNTETVDYDSLTRKIRRFAWYGDLHLNFSNQKLAAAVKAKSKTNFIINLKAGYSSIQSAYSPDLKQTLQKTNPDFALNRHNDFLSAIESYQEYYASRMPHVSEDDFSRLTILCKQLDTHRNCMVRSVADEKGSLLSNTLLLRDNKRIYHLFNTTTPEGRLQHSNHWLIDQILQEFSGQDLLFDFEGSELEGVKSFYKKFGGHIQPYFHYKRNFLKGI